MVDFCQAAKQRGLYFYGEKIGHETREGGDVNSRTLSGLTLFTGLVYTKGLIT